MLGKDGSYYVTAPYHEARSASAIIHTVYYERRRSTTTPEMRIDIGLLADDKKRLKLSHHPDGFAQFSGDGIVSGRNEQGQPKGIGIMSFPLSRPPRTGPSFSCTVLGLEGFDSGNTGKNNAINFENEDVPPLSGADGLVLEGSYFTSDWRKYLFEREGFWYLEMQHNMNTIIRYRALLSTSKSLCFIGIRFIRYDVKMADHKSGFILSGPSTNVRTIDGERMADGIFCSFPSQDAGEQSSRILDFEHENR